MSKNSESMAVFKWRWLLCGMLISIPEPLLFGFDTNSQKTVLYYSTIILLIIILLMSAYQNKLMNNEKLKSFSQKYGIFQKMVNMFVVYLGSMFGYAVFSNFYMIIR